MPLPAQAQVPSPDEEDRLSFALRAVEP